MLRSAACRRLLDDVAPSRADAATLVVARHAVRYPAPATGQARRSRGGPEAADQAAPADQHTGSGNLHTGAGTFAAPDRLNHGAAAPPVARSINLQPRPKPPATATAKWPRDDMSTQPGGRMTLAYPVVTYTHHG
jgi:hypothetical protein